MADVVCAQYDVHNFKLSGDMSDGNPFAVDVSATFEHSSGATFGPVPGFFDGDGWVIRFSPPQEGIWHGRTTSSQADLDGVALESLQCLANQNPNVHGVLKVDVEHPQRFAWADGTPFVYLGFECDWLFSYHQSDADRCYGHVDLIAKRGFNVVVTNLYAHVGFASFENDDERPVLSEHIYGPPKMFLFEGTNEGPDHSRFNVDFFRDFDRLISHLHQKGMAVHLMLQVQNKQVRWPEHRTVEDDRFWRYAVARYQAFGNVIWDVGKESKNLLRKTGSHDYVLERMAIIRDCDAYRHLVTVHDVEMRNAGTLAEPDWASDFVTDQVHLQDADRYNREAIRRLRNARAPYVNVEYGYELAEEQLKTYRSKTTAPWQDILTWTWSILSAGAYPCYYYDNTSWDLVKFDPEPKSWVRYRDMMDFIATLPFNEMVADNEYVERGFCLAKPGDVYLIFLPDGGNTSIDLSDVAGEAPAPLEAIWLAILTGDAQTVKVDRESDWSGFHTVLENPFDKTDQAFAVRLTAK